MLLRSRMPPPYSSFRTRAQTLAEGPMLKELSNVISDGSREEKKDGIATLVFMMDQGAVPVSDAVTVLGRALGDPEPGVRQLSFLNLARLGKLGLDGLFLGASASDSALRAMSLGRIYEILGKERNLMRCRGNTDFSGLEPKIGILISALEDQDQLVRTKATSCLREIASRSPLIALEAISKRKEDILKDTESFRRLSVVESAANDALVMASAGARC